MIGDLLISFGGHAISQVEDVHVQLTAEAIGKSMLVKFVRGGAAQETSIVVSERAHGGK
jgi:S1-C subfamily serine protease